VTEKNASAATWAELLGHLGRVRLRLEKLQPERYPLTVPHVAATERQLADAEMRLGYELDTQHRELLMHANGWPMMILDQSLLGCEEIGSGARWERACELLSLYYQESFVPSGFPSRDELTPIAVSEYQNDIYVIWRNGTEVDGGRPVLWLSYEEVERYSNVRDLIHGVIYRVGRLVRKYENANS
jgi:hypothetical protein